MALCIHYIFYSDFHSSDPLFSQALRYIDKRLDWALIDGSTLHDFTVVCHNFVTQNFFFFSKQKSCYSIIFNSSLKFVTPLSIHSFKCLSAKLGKPTFQAWKKTRVVQMSHSMIHKYTAWIFSLAFYSRHSASVAYFWSTVIVWRKSNIRKNKYHQVHNTPKPVTQIFHIYSCSVSYNCFSKPHSLHYDIWL